MFLTSICFGQVYKSVSLSAVNTLSSSLTSTEKSTVTNLTISGYMDARDFKTLRDELTNLTVLDISAVTISTYTGGAGPASTNLNTYYYANGIPQRAFYTTSLYNTKLKTVRLPNSATEIGAYAFCNCSILDSVKINSSLAKVSSYAFYNCVAFKRIAFPNTSLKIYDYSFANCTSLQYLKLSSTMKEIDMYAFDYCTALDTVIVQSATPFTLEAIYTPFTNITTSTCKLFVPSGSGSTYKAAPVWSGFNIVDSAEITTNVENTVNNIDIKIFPNPTIDKIQINNIGLNSNVSLFDLTGKKVLSTIYNDYIDLTDLKKGIYLVVIDNVFIQKLVKE